MKIAAAVVLQFVLERLCRSILLTPVCLTKDLRVPLSKGEHSDVNRDVFHWLQLPPQGRQRCYGYNKLIPTLEHNRFFLRSESNHYIFDLCDIVDS